MPDFTLPMPQKEHEWLHQLVGEWSWESDSVEGHGTEVVRSLGGIWIVAEGRGTAPDGTLSTTIMTLGYSPGRKKYVGTLVTSSMTDPWVYEGFVDRDSNALVLDTEGASFADISKRTRYKDIIRIVDEHDRTTTSSYQGETGTFDEFMTLRYRRTGK